jgi:hypothetical protein
MFRFPNGWKGEKEKEGGGATRNTEIRMLRGDETKRVAVGERIRSREEKNVECVCLFAIFCGRIGTKRTGLARSTREVERRIKSGEMTVFERDSVSVFVGAQVPERGLSVSVSR